MSPSPTPRKFAVEPVETTSKSSRQTSSPPNTDSPATRRFPIEPVETVIRSSRSPRPNSPETGEFKKPPRRYLPQPVETKVSSSRDKKEQGGEAPKPRKFAPVAVETSQRSSRQSSANSKPPVKFNPTPVETSYGSNRKKRTIDGQDAPPRKFTPMLLDTASRSRRNNATGTRQSDYKTESGHHLAAQLARRHITGTKTPAVETEDAMDVDSEEQIDPLQPVDIPSQLRRQLAPLSGSRRPRDSMSSQRSQSFLPALDTIESSESDDSSYNESRQHATRTRESFDAGYNHYILEVERKKARARMEEEALLTAFPNSEIHEPVMHYVDEQDSDEFEYEDRPVTWEGHDADEMMDLRELGARRESTAANNYAMLEAQRYAEKLQQERNAAGTTAKGTTKQPSASPWWPAGQLPATEANPVNDRARPPMLGEDLVFPRCPSPQPARFDVTQGSVALRNQMCYLTELSQSQEGADEGGLWQAKGAPQKPFTSVKSPAGSKSSVKGLWGGFCIEEENNSLNAALAPPPGPTGLMTPAPQTDTSMNPFDRSFAKAPQTPTGAFPDLAHVTTPPTPPITINKADVANIDDILTEKKNFEAKIMEEYPDSFITQVYNYLSLGHPALARPFDDELIKITHFTMAELRQDDKTARALPRGYIRLGPDFDDVKDEAAAGVTEETCQRWQALKLYVHEWARQEGNMVQVEQGAQGNWGARARRGSWAI